MTPDDFRRVALAQPGAEEASHVGKADFRLQGRTFATLGYPDKSHGMVKLAREQQELLMAAEPQMFAAAPGAWGLQGSTLVRLAAIDDATLHSALAMAAATAVAANEKGRRKRRPSKQTPESEA